LINPKRAAARIAVKRESTLIPGTNIEATNIAPVIINQRVIINTINLPLITISKSKRYLCWQRRRLPQRMYNTPPPCHLDIISDLEMVLYSFTDDIIELEYI
jgi:hypothetical protein